MKALEPCTLVAVVVLAAGAVRAVHAFDCTGVDPVRGEAVTLELVSDQLSRPVDVAVPPEDIDRLFVVEQTGAIRVFRLADDSLVQRPFLDIVSRVSCCGERGLLGLTFHPRYEDNGFFFVYYTRTGDGATVVSRFSVTADPERADPNSELILLIVPQPSSNHNGGPIAFGPLDGYLYIGTGDGGSACDLAGTRNNSQNPLSLLGKLLRIDVDNPDDRRNYGVPPDNPFVGEAGVRPEIWSLGLRNPWRIAFDRGAPDGVGRGDLYIADVGQNVWEEVDYQPAASPGGENYEWVVREGDHSSQDSGCSPTSLTVGTPVGPKWEYRHGTGRLRGCSITGGVVYRGCRMPDLHGAYFVADYCNHWIATFRIEDGKVVDLRDRTDELNEGIFPADRFDDIVSFGVDGRGDVYVCDLPSRLFRIVPVVSGNNPPTARIVPDPDPPLITLVGGNGQITLSGMSSDDGDGGSQGLTFLWEYVSGFEGYDIVSPNEASTEINFTVPGEFVFRLTVGDGLDNDSTEMTVTVEDTPVPAFRRGDSNEDGNVDLSDGVWTLTYLFLSGREPPCKDAADANDNGGLDLTDAVHTFNYLFAGGPAPPEPGVEACGIDATPEDSLGCAAYHSCED